VTDEIHISMFTARHNTHTHKPCLKTAVRSTTSLRILPRTLQHCVQHPDDRRERKQKASERERGGEREAEFVEWNNRVYTQLSFAQVT
jgi:hypothetical protein